MVNQIKMAKLNAEFNKRRNEISANIHLLEAAKHNRIQKVDDEYHENKRNYFVEIAKLRKKKVGLLIDDQRRVEITDSIRIIEDKLNLLKDERDIEARRVAGEIFEERLELEADIRSLNEWLEAEKIKVMDEQYAAKLAKEAAEFLQNPHIEQEKEGGEK